MTNENKIPTSASSAVEVNGEEKVTMWLGDVSVLVPKSSIGDFQGRGFVLLSKDQIHTVVSEIKAFAPQVAASAERYADGVSRDGEINVEDQAELATLMKAVKLLNEKVQALVTTTAQLYPVKPISEAVLMVDTDGREHAVDVGQVERYKEQGWSKK